MNNEEYQLFKQFLIYKKCYKRFKLNYDPNFSTRYPRVNLRKYLNLVSLSRVAESAFLWGDSLEGYEFWQHISRTLAEIKANYDRTRKTFSEMLPEIKKVLQSV